MGPQIGILVLADVRLAASLFEETVRLDPGFAGAWAELATTRATLSVGLGAQERVARHTRPPLTAGSGWFTPRGQRVAQT